jgi:predicted regulator of Ras-like GTPase activity (Roadblock/LC7/MglB family)
MAADDIRAMSEVLAADPSSMVFLQLGEALRRRGDLDVALRVAMRGVERHPQLPDSHDLVARVSADRGELERAIDEWETVLRLSPAHDGARKGLGFICFQTGRLEEAAAHLGAALAASPGDTSLAAALQTVQGALTHRTEAAERATVPVQRSTLPPEAFRTSGGASRVAPPVQEPITNPRATTGLPRELHDPHADSGALFDDLLEGQRSAAMLLDADGLVLAGRYVSTDGRDLAADIGAQLSGVSDEASRAMRHLGLGQWKQIVFETEAASVAMAPSQDGVLLVAAARPIPLGFVRRVLERALVRADEWLRGVA